MNTNNKIKKTIAKSVESEDDKPLFLSTGSTLLNLACTNHPQRGFPSGKYHLIVGDSASGKTFLSLTCLAEAVNSKAFGNYIPVLDDIEGGAILDIEKLFGKTLANKLQIEHSQSLEGMYDKVDDYLKKDQPFIYVVDSMDSLESEEDAKKFEKAKKARRAGREESGTYGTAKAKLNSTNLRRLMTPLRDSGSILILISQTRANLGFGPQQKTRAGGLSLRFYATLELWSSVREKIRKTVKGKPRTIGIKAKLEVKKNRVTGQERNVFVPIYYEIGFDDITSCIEYLIEENHWKKQKGGVNAPEFNFVGSMDKLISKIESENLHRKLQRITGRVWNEIEDACKTGRKPKYQ